MGEKVQMLTDQVSVRQTEYTSRGMLQNQMIQNNSRTAIFGSISPPYEHFYAHAITTIQQPIRAGNINICYRYKWYKITVG